MIPIFNEKYNYIMLYVPKAACSVMRKTYVDFHYSEFTKEQLSILTDKNKLFHGLAGVHSGNRLPSSVFYDTPRFIVARNPYKRALSAYYDKFIYLRNNNTWKTTKLYNLFCVFQITNDIELLKTLTSLEEVHKCNLPFYEYIKTTKINYNNNDNINDSFEKYLEFILMCKTHNIKTYDEHHDLQSAISNKFNINKVFKNPYIVQIENFQNNLTECINKLLSNKDDIERYLKLFAQNSQNPKVRNANFKQVYENIDGSVKGRSYFLKRVTEKETILNTGSMVSSKCEELIYNIYKQDFDLLSYVRKSF